MHSDLVQGRHVVSPNGNGLPLSHRTSSLLVAAKRKASENVKCRKKAPICRRRSASGNFDSEWTQRDALGQANCPDIQYRKKL